MRTLLLSLLLAGQSPVAGAFESPATGVSPTDQSVVTARNMLASMYPAAEREKLFLAMQNGLMANMISGFKAGMQVTPGCRCDQIIDRFAAVVAEDARENPIDMDRLFEIYARAYARNFTVADMRSITEFVRTPAGSHFMQRGQTMISDPDVSHFLTEQTAAGIRRLRPKLAAIGTEMAASKPKGVRP